VNTKEYLALVRAKLACTTDYKLSLVLNLPQPVVARYSKGGTFDNVMSVRVAEILGVPPLQVIADMEHERAKTEREKSRWKQYLQQFASADVTVSLAACAFAVGMTAAEMGNLYIM
jgi:hypothetical protein